MNLSTIYIQYLNAVFRIVSITHLAVHVGREETVMYVYSISIVIYVIE